MECEVCSRTHTSTLPFYCTTCARNALYEPRIEQARVLLQKENAGSTIAQATSKDRLSLGDSKNATLSSRYLVELEATEKCQAEYRLDEISTHLEILRNEVKSAKQEIAARRLALAERRRTMNTVRTAVKSERSRAAEQIHSRIYKKDQTWHAVHRGIQVDRVGLCRDVANLYCLKSKKTIRKGVASEQYSLGGVTIPDLREINNVRPEELSAAFANVAHLTALASHYLAVRLPAEIVLPHRGHPRPTIFPPAASYMQYNPSTATPDRATSSSVVSGAPAGPERRSLGRLRPLTLNKWLPQLAQDPVAYGLFIEGICLLAWDVAWLCRTQGLNSGTESWEDICKIGRNLLQLFGLSGSTATYKPRRNMSRGLISQQKHLTSNGGPQSVKQTPVTRLGEYSHGSAHSFLADSDGFDVLRGWKFARYASIADPLKKTLLGEMSNAEWELLEENEWHDGEGSFDGDETVLVTARDNKIPSAWDDARSVMTAANQTDILHDDSESATADIPRIKGTSGWTKLKPREKD